MAQVAATPAKWAWLSQPAGCRCLLVLVEHPRPDQLVELPQVPQLLQPVVCWMAQGPFELMQALLVILDSFEGCSVGS